MSRNDEIRALIRELGELTVLDEQSPQSFRARAYDRAVQALENVSIDLSEMTTEALEALPGIGKATASKIRTYVETGSIPKLEALRLKFPADVVQLSRIPGLGPKTLAKLRAELDIQNVADLVAAIEAEKLRNIPGLGAKTEEKLRDGIERLGFKQGEQRTPIAAAMEEALRWAERLAEHPDVVEAVPCGSLRRQRETVGDIDLVVATGNAVAVAEWVLAQPGLRKIIGSGPTKTSIIGAIGLQVDFRFVRPEQLGAALMYFTGSKAHNIKLRQIAMDRGWILNECRWAAWHRPSSSG